MQQYERNHPNNAAWRRRKNDTHGAAPNALFFVSERIAENVFVITATKRLMSQKLSTMRQTMKKKQDTKNSESIIWYMMGDHCISIRKCEYAYTQLCKKDTLTHSIGRRDNNHLQRRHENRVKARQIVIRIIQFLHQIINTTFSSQHLQRLQRKHTPCISAPMDICTLSPSSAHLHSTTHTAQPPTSSG